MNRYLAQVTSIRGGILYKSEEHTELPSALADAVSFQKEFPQHCVSVVNLDNIDYDCADGLTVSEREMVEEVVS
jgi:hypothetical protein